MPGRLRTLLFILLVLLLVDAGQALAAEAVRKPHQVINALRQRMYVIGETNPELARFVDAERAAAADIRAYVAGGADPAGLVERNDTGQTPLIAAAFMGYAEVVGELLKSDAVRSAIEETNNAGLSAWLSSNFASRQAMWVCAPKLFENPFAFVPLWVTQPYYTQPENPYRKTRRLLEAAGAKADPAQARQFWLDTCKTQSDATRKRVEAGGDLLDVVLAEGAATLARFIEENQRRRP